MFAISQFADDINTLGVLFSNCRLFCVQQTSRLVFRECRRCFSQVILYAGNVVRAYIVAMRWVVYLCNTAAASVIGEVQVVRGDYAFFCKVWHTCDSSMFRVYMVVMDEYNI